MVETPNSLTPHTDTEAVGPIVLPPTTSPGGSTESPAPSSPGVGDNASAAVISPDVDSRLVEVRLGIASSLFTAMRCKHPASAGHALRVALSSSAWATHLQLSAEERDAIEVGALLHDVGVIGMPDMILLKPGSLTPDEARIVNRSRRMSLEILSKASTNEAVLGIVDSVGAWYDGSRAGFQFAEKQIPLGGRMLSIVEAFDAMTSDTVYRGAMSQERAIAELFEFSGSQFDPELVERFVDFQSDNQAELRKQVADRWMKTLDPEMANSYWEFAGPPSALGQSDAQNIFETRLLTNMHDAVIFISTEMRVSQWNHGSERLTGIPASSILHQRWSCTLLGMKNEKGEPVAEEDCPVYCAIHSGVQSIRRLAITGRGGKRVTVDSHTIPVVAKDGATYGAIFVMHDASPETSLERRCQSLYDKTTQDPMTKVANRAEFDRVHDVFVATHQQKNIPCSLVICDLDQFKRVNDTYGHQAGDDAIKSLATLLKSMCRSGDLVARYGGEEFVLLCADCDNATATRRADEIRIALARIPQRRLEGRSITASFGVTEIQPGDTAETMLRRADRALLLAKERGRNRVVQLGSGPDPSEKRGRFSGEKKSNKPLEATLQRDLHTPVPVAVALEKLRGFVADHRAKILSIDHDVMKLRISSQAGPARRKVDRPINFHVELSFQEEQVVKEGREGAASSSTLRTRVLVTVRPMKARDRHRPNASELAGEVLVSIRSYLMATPASDAPTNTTSKKRRTRILPQWLRKRSS